MHNGLLVGTDGIVRVCWVNGDPNQPFPGEFMAQDGDQLIDLDAYSPDEARQIISTILHADTTDQRALLSGLPSMVLSGIPQAPPDMEICVQPGYRRICHRPTNAWHEQEIRSRIRANSRLANSEALQDVVDAEFQHLPGGTKRQRIGHAIITDKGYAQFSLTPMVRIVERKAMGAISIEDVKKVREFPYHIPVYAF